MKITEVERAIGQRIRERRHQLELTEADLAHRCGLAIDHIRHHESGGAVFAARLWLLAVALEVEVAYFYEAVSHSEGWS